MNFDSSKTAYFPRLDSLLGTHVYVGKTLFAQVMEFVPWTSFARIVQRHGGNAGVRSLSCAEQFRAMAFAQLTWRESLRDVEASLSANSTKLYAMGFRSAVKRSTLADANESRDWRIWSDLAAVLIRRARKLYASDSLGVELDNTVYALDSSTVDLCLSLFDWAPFRSTKAAIKLHTLLDLRGAIPAFIHISDGKMGDVNVLDMLSFEAGAFYVMDRGYLDFTRLHRLHQAGAFFVTRAKRRHGRASRLLEAGGPQHWFDLRSARDAHRLLPGAQLPRASCGASNSRIPRRARRWSS